MTTGNDESALKAKVLRQLEYYFGDVNVQRDRFLQDEMKKNHGWVPITVLLTFNRLKQLTTDQALIADAIKESHLIDLSEDKEKIRRNPEVPLPENSLEFWTEVKSRTAYIKGFEPENTLDDIQEYLAPFGKVVNIVLRRLKPSRVFKGSVFATFETKEEAEKFVANEDCKTFNGKEMTRLMQNEYWAQTIAETKERRAAEKALKRQKNDEAEKAFSNVHYQKGQILLIKNVSPTASFTTVRDFLSKYGEVAFVTRDGESSEASVRFKSEEEGAATRALEKITEDGDNFAFEGNKLEASVLTGDDEDAYWADFTRAKAERHNRISDHRRGGRKRHNNDRNNENHRGNKRPRGGVHKKFGDDGELKEELKDEPAESGVQPKIEQTDIGESPAEAKGDAAAPEDSKSAVPVKVEAAAN